MAMARDAWIAYMAKLQSDWRAFAQEFDPCERTVHAPVVDDFIRSLLTEWSKRGRRGW